MRKRQKNRSEQNLDFKNQNRKEVVNSKRELNNKGYSHHQIQHHRDKAFGNCSVKAERRHRCFDLQRPDYKYQKKQTWMKSTRGRTAYRDGSTRKGMRGDLHFQRTSKRTFHRRPYVRELFLNRRSTRRLVHEKIHLEAQLNALQCELRRRFAYRKSFSRRLSKVQ